MFPVKLIFPLALMPASICAAGPAARLSEVQVRHLPVRTGFALLQAEVIALTDQSASAAVSSLMAQAQRQPPLKLTYAAPDFAAQDPSIFYRLLQSREEQQQHLRGGLEMRAGWLREMIVSPTPLIERKTLFWRNHFATSQQKVNHSQVARQQPEGATFVGA